MKKANLKNNIIEGEKTTREYFILDLSTNKKTYYNSKKELTNKHSEKYDLINYIKNDNYNIDKLKTYKAKNGVIKAYIINDITNDIVANRKTKKACYIKCMTSELYNYLLKHNLSILNNGAYQQIYYFN
jgi:hypothetical protein